MVRVGEDQKYSQSLVMSVHGTADNALGVLPERVKASLRSRAIVSQERIRVYSTLVLVRA